MSNNKTFLIGLGAQKTGTTWLHRYLNSSPSADFGRMKEYHVFDALHVPGSERYRYERTLEAIYGAFEPEEYRLFLFEEFFRDETVMQLSELLGMNLPAADFTVRVNTSRKAGHEIPDELRKRFVDYYRSAYLAAFDAFGEEKIRSLWPNASLV